MCQYNLVIKTFHFLESFLRASSRMRVRRDDDTAWVCVCGCRFIQTSLSAPLYVTVRSPHYWRILASEVCSKYVSGSPQIAFSCLSSKRSCQSKVLNCLNKINRKSKFFNHLTRKFTPQSYLEMVLPNWNEIFFRTEEGTLNECNFFDGFSFSLEKSTFHAASLRLPWREELLWKFRSEFFLSLSW